MTDKVDRLPILVTTMGVTKLLEISKIPAWTVQAEVEAVNNAIRKWRLEDAVRGMCFDTSSNTGRFSGACIILEKQLGRPLLHFGCRQYILELVLAAVGPAKHLMLSALNVFKGSGHQLKRKTTLVPPLVNFLVPNSSILPR